MAPDTIPHTNPNGGCQKLLPLLQRTADASCICMRHPYLLHPHVNQAQILHAPTTATQIRVLLLHGAETAPTGLSPMNTLSDRDCPCNTFHVRMCTSAIVRPSHQPFLMITTPLTGLAQDGMVLTQQHQHFKTPQHTIDFNFTWCWSILCQSILSQTHPHVSCACVHHPCGMPICNALPKPPIGTLNDAVDFSPPRAASPVKQLNCPYRLVQQNHQHHADRDDHHLSGPCLSGSAHCSSCSSALLCTSLPRLVRLEHG